MPNYQIDGQKAYKPGLENITKLCDFFRNPQEKLKMIHIGGTNGKGSTSNMLASVLQEQGYKIGLYNSPHLIDFTERIKINGDNCEKEFVFDFIQKLRDIPEEILPSFFEFTTIMAFEYFYQKKIDYAIIEVGLGGRLDSTNIIKPLVAAITNVDLDHQNILGETLEEIATEKAGIVKPNIPIISGDERDLVKNIIQQKAIENKSEFIDATVISTDLETDLKGNYQKKNIRVVQALVDELRKQNIEISESSLENGLMKVHQNTKFIGRWFQFSENPLIICDTAHNQAGLEMVFAQLNAIEKYKHIVLGFVNDKKIDEVLKILPKNAQYYFVKPSISRGRSPKEYEGLLVSAKIGFQIFETVDAGFQAAKIKCKPEEMIFVGGSNFVVGEFLEKNL
ncbi:bifunctional folylpolyglutamate synthase/dihydrofolate synthase [Cloacibacterium sp. TD35]|uniref:bifunctional folylpolyglutamate synthase/dihydrofolate synthase n=1 Tax=Cloacibacterium sp. TD35 TaxID=2976818 RepID=UPI00237E7F3F|nr:folylpolyglutamate synthase/dihydrofolate synthase family protein [Cloacibacterium sp. TD35]WDT69174.1 bifunctional folylpolyglutamate synthase/dihydrofolate synthase [Cloacibacterium sp. TD35]